VNDIDPRIGRDPLLYAPSYLIEQLDTIDKIKKLIIEYFSDNLQTDDTPMGAMKRNQIRKELLEFASK
jgi:hypothetical protein